MATQPSEHSKIPPYPSHPHRRPAVPDLRFEHSYIRSIAPYVHVEHRPPASASPAPKTHDLKGKAKAVEFVDDAEHEVTLEPREDIRIQWTQVLWITCRDQVLSPFLQGAIWYVRYTLTSTCFSTSMPLTRHGAMTILSDAFATSGVSPVIICIQLWPPFPCGGSEVRV